MYQIKKQEILNTLYSEGAVFITGGAGSGKSHMLRDITSMFRETVLLAPTGISGSNIGGQTIHKFLGLSRSLFRPSDIVRDKKNDKKFVNLIKATDLIILDEVSMCSPLILDTFDEVLRATTMNRNHLFGGKRVILCGDIAQLPPVVREEEAKFLSDEFGYKDMSPMSSKVFKEITMVELKGSYRQRDDQYFADTLNFIRRARMGSLEPGSILEFNQKLFGMNNQCYLKKPEEEAVCLVYTNKEASLINEKKIARVGGRGSTYVANEQGSWKSGNSRAVPELYLKPGARVVCIANIKGTDIYNGDTGVVESTGVDHVRICVDRTGDIECITPYTWEAIEYGFKPGKGFTTQVTGKLTQIPLLLAYACTIHSSQGTTMEKVHIPKFSGMDSALIYVALSRAQRMDDLSFGEPLWIDKFVGLEELKKNGLARSYRDRRPKGLSEQEYAEIAVEIQRLERLEGR